ncbi:MAG: hypothetical protein M1837_001632 [Sclerophora amabilis]|nr:MAG: hypothetical protein M1837_001632 [Sclerophora amabilis]
MSLSSASPAELIRRLAHSPALYDQCMIHYPKSRPITVTCLPLRNSSSGSLDVVPSEILRMIFVLLDFESLRTLRLVNFGIKDAVESLPAYRDMVKHGSIVLRALVETCLHSHYSAAELYDVLRSDRCVGCTDHGPFFLLPACQRVCFNCLNNNREMRVITAFAANICFGLSKRFLKKHSDRGLPAMLTLPGLYGIGLEEKRIRRWVVSVSKARALGLRLYGSQLKMESSVQAAYSKKRTAFHQREAAWLSRRQSGPAGSRPRKPPDSGRILSDSNDQFHFQASSPFPFLDVREGKVDHGLWCLGCQDQYVWHRIRTHDVDYSALKRNESKAYTEQEILRHFIDCPGSKRLWDQHCQRNNIKNDDAALSSTTKYL